MRITVYTKPACQPCHAVKRWLDRSGNAYDELPAEGNFEALKRLGAMGTPVTIIPTGVVTYVVHGYNPDFLAKYTRLHVGDAS